MHTSFLFEVFFPSDFLNWNSLVDCNPQFVISKYNHYENLMQVKVLTELKEVEKEYQELEHSRKESYKKASIICSETDIETLGSCKGNTPEQLSAQLTRLSNRLQQESRRHSESIDDLRTLHENKERMIFKRQQTYKAFREKLSACRKALDLRWSKFQRNASLLKRQLTWQFNGHLGKKGISGKIIVNYEKKTLSVERTISSAMVWNRFSRKNELYCTV
ncbi:unnamed protein product [Cuscuta campestris]|uniref:Uncharacterized protein n=1 Tax=Cuscuta campestris TaxID=132261 RepID=A0A484KU20_9ASTE|nr:unnamed protein product [Cuscuta campestris]